MSREQILDEVRRTIASLFELDPGSIREESRLGEDLDLDSIDAIDLVIKLQDLTGRRVDQDQLARIRTVGDIVDVVARLSAQRA